MSNGRRVFIAGGALTPFTGKGHPDFIWKRHPDFGVKENPTLEELLQSAVDGGQVHYIDLFSAPFDYNAFDNLPLSLSVPNTFSTKLPKKLQKASFSLVEND